MVIIACRAHGDAMLEPIRVSSNMVTEFCYKSVNLLLEELINIKVILFLRLEQC